MGEEPSNHSGGASTLSLVILTIVAIVAFVAVGALTRAYRAQELGLAQRWAARAAAESEHSNFRATAFAYRAALHYARENPAYLMGLARSLVALQRTQEAEPYLLSLWEQHPEDGAVNLELARVYAQSGETEKAMRYYHNAIYGIWKENPDAERRQARLELVDFFLRRGAREQAQAELIAMASNLPDDVSLRLMTGGLFLEVGDYVHALQQYKAVIRMDPNNDAALAGAGRASFELANYAGAQNYLQRAVAGNPHDQASADLLKTTSLILKLDPFTRRASSAARVRSALDAFSAASQRLQSCISSQPPNGSLQDLSTKLNSIKPRLNVRRLEQDSDLLDQAMELVFAIERETAPICGTGSPADQALLTIAGQRGGNER